MCGIVGFTGIKDQQLLHQMVRVLTHRGPDEEGFFTDQEASLGMRRLSIIDLKTGSQPIYNERRDIVTVFNGEIYNFKELRKDLLKKGHQFKTKTDTEVIVHLYEDWGEKLVEKLDGMFALAVWDSAKKKLILARDRFGKKPLFHSLIDKNLIFASEIKSILLHPKIKKELNFEALHHYFSLKHVPAPLTIFKYIFSLPAGSYLVYHQGKINIQNYWTLKYNLIEPKVSQEKKVLDQLDQLLNLAVKKRLVSDVPVGAYLSGGVDSSLVATIFRNYSRNKFKTFCLTYGKEIKHKQADLKFARLVAKKLGTEHYEYQLSRNDFFNDLVNVIKSFDQPFAGVISTFFISKLIARHVKVAISGDGADELFGSYLAPRLVWPISNYLKTGESNLTLLKPFEKQLDFLKKIASTRDWQWRSKLVVYNEEEKRQLYQAELTEGCKSFNTTQLYKNYFDSSKTSDPVNRVLDVDCRSLLADQVLPFVDFLSMAHSIEVRCPFLDRDFSEYVASLPGSWKIRNGETKYILKKLAEKYLPKELIYRAKEGFIPPVNQWLAEDKKFIFKILSEENLRKHNFFKYDYIKKIINEMDENDSTSVNKVWSLIIFQLWWQEYF